MDTLMALQNLAVTVNGLKESIHLSATRVSTISNENNHRASEYHSKFSELLGKYSGFANEYRFELDHLHKSLLNDINLQQKEREEQEREFQEKLESLSNKSSHSNLEIAENVEETEYHSSANSMNNMNLSSLNSPQRTDSEFENTASINIPIASIPSPQAMKSKKSVPISKPKPKPAPKRSNNTKKSNGRKKKKAKKAAAAPKAKVTTKPAPKKETKTASKPLIVRTVTADIEKKEEGKNEEEPKYVYNADKVRFNLDFKVWNDETKKFDKKVYKHTTLIYIGNIPSNIKVAAMQFFIMKKFKVSMRQIEETKLQKGRGFTQYALIRFRSDVPLDHITKYMQMLNGENARIKEDKKAAQDTMHVISKKSKKDKDGSSSEKKKKVRTSWQTKVFIKFQDPEYHYSYYDTEDAMYSDRRAKHALFVRNFDVLDKKCHKELTDKLLAFGDIVKDIDIKIDSFGDPYCIVIFKYMNDAVYCCNSDVYFGGRRLELRYSKY